MVIGMVAFVMADHRVRVAQLTRLPVEDVRDPRLVAHPEETGEQEPDPGNRGKQATRAWGA